MRKVHLLLEICKEKHNLQTFIRKHAEIEGVIMFIHGQGSSRTRSINE